MIQPRSIHPLLVLALFTVSAAGDRIRGADCNDNGSSDEHDIVTGLSQDCNQNLVPDECDILLRGAAFEELSKASVGQRPLAAGAGDLDGDGDVDLITANQDSNDATVLLGEEDRFVRGPTITVGRQPLAVAAGDMDGDGDTDAVVSNFSDRTLSLLEQDGSGGFMPTPIDSGVGLVRLASSDFDADGDLDLAGTDFNSYVRILFNEAGGAFPRFEMVFAGDQGGRPDGITAGDLDGDGDVDLATANSQSTYQGISILWNDGSGTFALDAPQIQADFHPIAVATSDVDADGKLDLVFTNGDSSGISVHRNAGGGTFGGPAHYPPRSPKLPTNKYPRQLACEDLTGDGFPDVAVADAGANGQAGSLLVFYGTGDGSFIDPRTVFAGGMPNDVLILGVDADGRKDLVAVKWQTNEVIALRNVAAPLSDDCDENGRPDECDADCDGDGTSDACEISNGTAVDSNSNGLPDACEPDCNQNGVLDEVDISGGASKDCNYNLVPDECDVAPTLGFASASGYSVGEYAIDIVAGDFDGEGRNDLAVLGASSEDVTILLNDGAKSFGESGRYFANLNPITLAGDDLDGDGDVDIAVAGARSRDIVILRNNGQGRLVRGVPFAGVEDPNSLESADLDADGDADLVLGSTRQRFVAVYSNSGGFVDPPVKLGVQVMPFHVYPKDVDADSDLDLAITGTGLDGLVELVFNLGGGEFDVAGDGRGKDPAYVTEIGGPTALVAGDFGGGPGIDYAAVDPNGNNPGPVVVLLDIGQGGSLERAQVLEPVGGAMDLTIGDVDQDQDLDLIVAGANVNVYANDGDGVFAHRGSFRMPDFYGEILASDLDDDGALDFAATGYPDRAWVLWNRGDGRSPAMNTYETGQGTQSVVVEDLDSDGDFDVAAAAYFARRITIVRNAGDGQFDSSHRIELPDGPDNLATGLLDPDGFPDLVASMDTRIAVIASAGAGAFAPPLEYPGGDRISDVVIADLDADGDLDLGASNLNTLDLSLLLNRGDASFGAVRSVAVGAIQTALCAADFDADGRIDLASSVEGSHIPHGIIFHWNRGAAEFDPGEGRPQHLTENKVAQLIAADLDNDGKLDAASVEDGANAVSVFRNLGMRAFDRAGSFPAGGGIGLAAGDLDRDGYLDAVVNGARSLNVLRNKGDGTFERAVEFPVGGIQFSVALGYLDGDGDIDAVVGLWEDGEVGIFYNHASDTGPIDCDENGVADMFQLGLSRDCNGNDIPDSIDIHAGRSTDANDDGVPDECEGDRAIFHRGDSNADGTVNITDAILTLSFLFLGAESPTCLEAANTNNDARLDIADGISLLAYLFLGSEPPAPPGPPPGRCGFDPDNPGSADDLGCDAYGPCEPGP